MKQQVIYKIINTLNQKFYVGSTNDQKQRFRTHRRRLRAGTHHCAHLQAAWNKYGEDKFVFVVIEVHPDDANLQAAEDVWLIAHVGNSYCYNTGMRSDAPWRGIPKEKHPCFGRVMDDSQKNTLRAARLTQADPRLGTTHTEEVKERIRQKKLANPTRYWEGKERSEETKQKISAKQAGRPKAPGRKVSEEGRAKIAANIAAGRSHMHWLGKTHSEESKLKMSRRVCVTHADGTEKIYASITQLRQETGISPGPVNAALKSGKPISRGKFAGWVFKYVDPSTT